MPEVGSILQERYQLKQQLSDNPIRETWLAEDITVEETVVVKLLLFGGQDPWQNLKLFEREAKVLQNLQHPAIPSYRDYFVIDDQKLWSGLVQDYIPGESLMDLLSSGQKFTEEEVRSLVMALLNILTYLHELNPPLLHRDIKPSNIIFGEDKQVYLVDFGAVQDRSATDGKSFTVVGTYGYTPLEQFAGQTCPASDLYALGATSIHLLTGTPPAELLQQNLRLEFRDRINANLSPYFVKWLETLVEPQLDQRFTSARQAIAALEKKYALPEEPGTILPPDKSQIRLNTTQKKLEIYIPEPGLKILDLGKKLIEKLVKAVESSITAIQNSTNGSDLSSRIFVYTIVGIGTITFLSLTLNLAIGILPFLLPLVIGASLTDYFEQTAIYFDRTNDTFTIDHKRLGFTYRQEIGITSEIQEMNLFYDNRKFVTGVMLTAGPKLGEYQQYSFGNLGRTLTEEECVWLLQQIQDWLDIDGKK